MNKRALSATCTVAIYTIAIIVLLWIGLSWIEVLTKNVAPDPVYNPWNFMQLIVRLGGR